MITNKISRLLFLAFLSVSLISCKKNKPTDNPSTNSRGVYTAGSEGIFAKYWKDGTGVNLSDGNRTAVASSITVSGSDVYVAGSEFSAANKMQAKYWKN